MDRNRQFAEKELKWLKSVYNQGNRNIKCAHLWFVLTMQKLFRQFTLLLCDKKKVLAYGGIFE